MECNPATPHGRLRGVLSRTGHEDPADPSTVRAMPIIMHLPKADPPVRADLLSAAARASVAVCLDPAAEQFLSPWFDAAIRKIARRARASKWDAVQGLSGATVTTGTASARALWPAPVSEVDPRVAKLQIEGADLPVTLAEVPSEGLWADEPCPVIYVDASLSMTVGKAAAQVGHGSMLLAAALDEDACTRWEQAGFPLVVREVSGGDFSALREQMHALAGTPGAGEHRGTVFRTGNAGAAAMVTDAGYTEIAPGSVTVIATAGGRGV